MKVGILGNGQLGMMLGEALRTLPHGSIEITCYGPEESSPASRLLPCVVQPYDDGAALQAFIDSKEVVTYEFENIPPPALAKLREHPGKVFPPVIALETMQNRIREKALAISHGAKTAEYCALDQATAAERIETLQKYARTVGYPLIVKTNTFGYDGKGQITSRTEDDLSAVRDLLSVPCIVERLVGFSSEVSLLSCRGISGEIVHYPLTENFHREGILRVSRTGAPSLGRLQLKAESIAAKILTDLRYVGLLTIEFFVVGEELYINEFAPRVHNSGHWTVEGAETSQFENHLRAISGMALGSTVSKPALMYNLLGTLDYDHRLLADGTLHDYHKTPRELRKVGHVTVVRGTFAELPDIAKLLS